MLKNTIILGLIAVAGMANAADLIENGGFEMHPAPYQNGSWSLYYNTGAHTNPVTGWYSDNNGIPIEIGTPGTYGVTGDSTNSVLELDSTQNSSVSQHIHGHGDHGQLELTFDFGQRAGTTPETNNFEVLWDGHVVATVDPTSTAMTTISPITVYGHGHDTLTFAATGTSDSYGGIVDNVHLNNDCQAVPEPVSMTLLGMGAMALLRRKRN